MNTTINDIMIHIEQTLDGCEFDLLADYVQRTEGVVSIGRDEERPRFISVGYSPESTTSVDILNMVADCGLKASLIGVLQILK